MAQNRQLKNVHQDGEKFLHSENQVLLVGGKCQNPLADGSDDICGNTLGAHPLSQGKHISVFHDDVKQFPCPSW